ncbi:hypothetical protein LPUS_11022 [Lasallia pustulata]|uniref:Glycosyltransferase 2 n=1 Tax=Lasallia pustulata TaxID=136370 RepID=A0A1W5DB66_9LECA|nr:hypothetical protein LPUS_11022 [Lasallia pustulata]
MPLAARLFADDEELGKKDDDHRPGKGVLIPAIWPLWQTPLRVRRRRLALGFAALMFLYFFIKYIPTDLGPANKRGNMRTPTAGGRLGRPPAADEGSSMDQPPHADKHYYNGPIYLNQLAATLHGIAKMRGQQESNKNVLFAVSNLKSASELIPIACDMALWKRTFVHFTLMGREDLPIDALKEVNQVTEECNIHWHDARPDYSAWSTDLRMEVSVGASLGHIHNFMHPQVIITDDLSKENPFFVKAIRAKAKEIGRAIIELPADAAENLMWITRLDSASLQAWNNAYIDILIHAPVDSSGSLIRLLRSIEQAHYFGSRPPHLTIELPPEIDPPTQQFLDRLVWPPIDPSGGPHTSQVTLRHRIPRQSLSVEESASHFIESFYPARSADSHVLVLSPQVELSPLYYHYLKYNLLEYKYSSYSRGDPSSGLMGLSLELPTAYLNDSAPLDPPSDVSALINDDGSESTEPTPFLWQAPNSNAALYFGDKWIELHSFLSNRIAAHDSASPPPKRSKQVSQKYPSWMEYALELMRARAYALLYPNIPALDSIVTVHNELYQIPEEFLAHHQAESPPADEANPSSDPHEPFTVDPTAITPASPSPEHALLSTPLLSILPSAGDLPDLDTLPFLSHSGQLLTLSDAYKLSATFAAEFRRDIGGCRDTTKKRKPVLRSRSADDLFCLDERVEKNGGGVGVVKDEAGGKKDADWEVGSEFGKPVVVDVDGTEEAAKEFAAHLARQGGEREG